MHLIYIDDSGDEKLRIFSALAIPSNEWRNAFAMVKAFRRGLKQSDGIRVQEELHAWKFVAGRGDIADRVVTKYRRSQIFREALELTAQLPGALLYNAIFPKHLEERAFERLLNRINVGMKELNSHALLICDEGKEIAFTRLARRMSVHNHIPSMFGQWDSEGTRTKNIPTDRILEDPIFKKSERSYFIQLADMCAFALLRQERPTPAIQRYSLETAFDALDSILVKKANRHDPRGIIRPK